jgi:hypothetical protein
MNREEKYIARIILENKILSSDGQAYEDLFARIMEKKNPNFRRVKPQGQIGDKKNDGFDKTTGTYYQVFAPEDLKKSEGRAVLKLTEDFKGLVTFWDSISPIKAFFYVLNDKYKGTYPTIEAELAQLQKNYGVPCESFLNKDLENIFWELNDWQIIDVIGIVPTSAILPDVDFSEMRKVVEYLLEKPANYSQETRPVNLNFEGKIEFNSLSNQTAELIRNGNLQSHYVDEYFRIRSDFSKEDLRQRFATLYTEGVGLITDSDHKNDTVFFHIFENATPRKIKPIQDAVLVLMAYYFEFCDIFEAPI